MCIQIIRHHTVCNDTHEFMVIEYPQSAAKNKKWEEKRSFWSKLFRSKPSCKIILKRESRDSWCPFCKRANNLDYPSDNYGIDFVAADSDTKVTPQGKSREEFPSGWPPNHQDLTMPEIQSNIVDPGIDWIRWDHVRDHIIPPRSGPPPDRPLPPTPVRSQPTNVKNRQASVSQGRQRNTSGHRIPRKPVAGQSSEGGHMHSIHQVDGPAGPILPRLTPQNIRREPSVPLILDKNREVPEMALLPEPDLGRPLTFAFLQSDESTGQETQPPLTPVRRGGSGTNRSRYKPNKFQSSPMSPLTPDADTTTTRYVDRPSRRAHTTNGRHENAHSVYGDMAYISPRLEKRIDDVEKYWTAGARQPEDRYEMRIRAETEPIQQKGKGKPKTGKRVQFDDLTLARSKASLALRCCGRCT